MCEKPATTTSQNASGEDSSEKSWTFGKKWRIRSSFRTLTSIHMGSGDTTTREGLKDDNDKPADINAHTVDFQQRACIFASAIKGSIRSWAERNLSCGKAGELLCRVMGNKEIQGGLARFHDARIRKPLQADPPLPWWSKERQTWVEAANSIDRHTRTTADGHLLYNECMPAGLCLDFVITGVFEEEELLLLLALLAGFNQEENPILLGADTANGKGRVAWCLEEIACLDQDAVRAWLQDPKRSMAFQAYRPLTEKAATLTDTAFSQTKEAEKSHDWLDLAITLHFDSHFLVGHPTLKDKAAIEQKAPEPDQTPRLDERGHVILPGRSFKGAFRSQAERILRTLGHHACYPYHHKSGSNSACAMTATMKIEEICIACRIFGATGWKSCLEISDFLAHDRYKPETQDFVAIDRFTGGGKDGAKFNISAVYKPKLHGKIRINMKRLPQNGSELGLLALVLRDLKEGDITFGMAAAKGYGTCTADIDGWEEFLKKAKPSFELLMKMEKEVK